MGEVHTHSDLIEYFIRVFGRIEHGSGSNIQVKCPYCLEEKAEHGIPLRKRKLAILLTSQVWHCWNCARKGHILKVVRRFATKDQFYEYMRRFADKDALRIHEHEEEEYRPSVLPPDFTMLATNKTNPYVKQALRYLRKRGIEERDLWYFKFGVAGEWPWSNRVIMPSFDEHGDLNYFVGRDIGGQARFKYFDSELTKKHIIFNELNIDWSEELTITEGIFDLLKCNDNAVPLLGSDLSMESVLFMKIIQNKTPVLLALDDDMGDSKIPWITKMLMAVGIRVRILNMDGYKDVGDMTKEVFLQRREEAKLWTPMNVLKDKIRRKIKSRSIL